MFRRLFVVLVLVAAVAGCASKSETSSSTTATQAQTAGPFSVATQFAPDPPKQGPETITVTVTDAGGNPITGATVKIVTKMPTMSMSGPTLTTTDNGDGTYAAQTNLNYATQWTFDISVSAGARSGIAHVVEDVK